ncbi:MAG: DUF1844 domain-containing protein [Acidobacteria bacterium]|nr:DUF1844 domain-containing protein [Acidobacteriota bacterium]
MAEKKQDQGFTITDRRLFNFDGDLRSDAAEEAVEPPQAAAPQAASPAPAAPAEAIAEAPAEDAQVPPPPSSAEQQAQADAYKKSSKELDARVELSGHSAKELEMTFERFLASLYMTAMMQLGLMHEQGGQPRVDIIGARQTIDTLSLIGEKSKGNLTPTEENFMQNSLYELRMAYVEVTNALSRPPQPAVPDLHKR